MKLLRGESGKFKKILPSLSWLRGMGSRSGRLYLRRCRKSTIWKRELVSNVVKGGTITWTLKSIEMIGLKLKLRHFLNLIPKLAINGVKSPNYLKVGLTTKSKTISTVLLGEDLEGSKNWLVKKTALLISNILSLEF